MELCRMGMKHSMYLAISIRIKKEQLIQNHQSVNMEERI